MSFVLNGLRYLLAGLLGITMAVVPTLLVSWAIFPPDGPIGEGLIILLIHLVSCCICVPIYIALMARHVEGRRDTPKLIVYEVLLRVSMSAGGCFLCFMAIEVPTQRATKVLFCLLALAALLWSINPATWAREDH